MPSYTPVTLPESEKNQADHLRRAGLEGFALIEKFYGPQILFSGVDDARQRRPGTDLIPIVSYTPKIKPRTRWGKLQFLERQTRAESEAEEERRDKAERDKGEQRWARVERVAEEERRARAKREAEEERRTREEREAEEERRAKAEREAEEERRAREERQAEEERQARVEREAQEERRARVEREAEEERQARVEREAKEQRTRAERMTEKVSQIKAQLIAEEESRAKVEREAKEQRIRAQILVEEVSQARAQLIAEVERRVRAEREVEEERQAKTERYSEEERQVKAEREAEEERQAKAKRLEEIVNGETLYKAICDNNWTRAKAFLDENPTELTAKVTSSGKTALHVAALFGHVSIVEELMRLVTDPKFLETTDDFGNTPLLIATVTGITPVAECLVNKNTNILGIPNSAGELPITLAFLNGHQEMGRYLYSKTPLEYLHPDNEPLQGAMLLHCCLQTQCFDIALDLLNRCQELLFVSDKEGWKPIYGIATLNSAIPSRNELVFWKRFIFDCK